MVWFLSCIYMYFHFSSMRITLIRKGKRVHKAASAASDTSVCSTIYWLCFLDFIPIDRVEICHMKTTKFISVTEPAQLPSSYEEVLKRMMVIPTSLFKCYHTNLLAPRSFWLKHTFLAFLTFSGWIWAAKLAPICSKWRLQHESMPFFVLQQNVLWRFCSGMQVFPSNFWAFSSTFHAQLIQSLWSTELKTDSFQSSSLSARWVSGLTLPLPCAISRRLETGRELSLGLKEQCHEDFAVLGQFCAKIITLRL